MLKEKLRYLEEGKALKETRFNEMIEKEALLKGEINQIKNHNEDLQNQIKGLQELLNRRQQNPQVERLEYHTSENEQFAIYINPSEEKSEKSEQIKKSSSRISAMDDLLGDGDLERDEGILVSQALPIQINEEYDLDKQAQNQLMKQIAEE